MLFIVKGEMSFFLLMGVVDIIWKKGFKLLVNGLNFLKNISIIELK